MQISATQIQTMENKSTKCMEHITYAYVTYYKYNNILTVRCVIHVGVNHSPPWLDPKTYNRTVAETLRLILLYDTLYPEDYLDNANKILIFIY